MKKKSAVIVGAGGQDGQLLSALLKSYSYEFVEIRKDSHGARVESPEQISSLVTAIQPDEVYYLAACHHSSQDSNTQDAIELFDQSHQVNVRGLFYFLEAIRSKSPKSRVFYAGSSHIFGDAAASPQDETTPYAPNSTYGLTKAIGLQLVQLYRRQYGLFASGGILFNHESHLRQSKFISKRIVRTAVDIKLGQAKELIVGDLSAIVDWGYAPDYVDAMHRILNIETPEDFVIATGKENRVQDFVKIAFDALGLNWELYVKENSQVITRKPYPLIGNSAKLFERTGWKPSVGFEAMVRTLVQLEWRDRAGE